MKGPRPTRRVDGDANSSLATLGVRFPEVGEDRRGLGNVVDMAAAAVTIVKVVAFLAIMAATTGLGTWFGVTVARKQGNIPPGKSAIAHLREGMHRRRRARRELLTRGERVFDGTMAFLSMALVPAGVVTLVWGGSSLRPAGIVSLVVGLVVMAVPTGPILQARVRRRQQASGSQ